MTLGDRIKQARLARNMTQQDLALRVGVRERYVSDWERSAVIPRTDRLPAIAEALDVTIDYLVTGSAA